MRKKKIISLILAIVLIISLPIGVYFYPALFKTKDNDPGNNGGNNNTKPGIQAGVSVVSHVLETIAAQNYKIFDTYSSASSAENYSASEVEEGEVENYAYTALSKQQLQTYFNALQQCVIVPAALDYVVNSADSDVYQNPFELDQTYYCKEITSDETHVYYYKAEMDGELINLYLENEGYFIICQIRYDFENDVLISAKTMADNIFAEIDYAYNTFTCAMFDFNGTLNDVLSGDFDIEDIIPYEYNVKYNGNITDNINRIRFDEVSLTNPSSMEDITKTEIKNFMAKFAIGVNTDNILNKTDVVVNNSFADSMEYSMRRLDFSIRENPNNLFEFEFISTWVGVNEAVKFLDDLSKVADVASNTLMKSLVLKFKNYLADNESAYTGSLDFIVPNPSDPTNPDKNLQLSISKTKKDLDAFMVSIIVGDNENEILELSCKYESGVLTATKRETAQEDSGYFEPDHYYYTINTTNPEDKYIELQYIYTYGKVANVPEELTVSEGTFPVRTLDRFSVTFAYGTGGVVNIPACITEIDMSSWFDATKLNVAEENPNYQSIDGVLYTKDKGEGITLVRYPACATRETYTIEAGTVAIADGAFMGDMNLKVLNVPASVVSGLEGNVFYAVKSLTAINVTPNSVYTSFDGVVYNADCDTLIRCPAGKKGAFTVRNGVTAIAARAFEYCRELTEINMPSTVASFGEYAFRLCEKLNKLTLPESLGSLGSGFNFDGLISLNEVVVPSGCAMFTVDENGFVYNSNKTTLYFCPRNFVGNVTIASTVTKIADYAFENCTGIKDVVIPENVTWIGTRAFMYSSVKNVTIQGTVAIDYQVFMRSSLETLTIHALGDLEPRRDDMNYGMEWNIVDECDNLKVINFGGTTTEWAAGVHENQAGNEWFGYYDIPSIKVVCSNGEIPYSKSN